MRTKTLAHPRRWPHIPSSARCKLVADEPRHKQQASQQDAPLSRVLKQLYHSPKKYLDETEQVGAGE